MIFTVQFTQLCLVLAQLIALVSCATIEGRIELPNDVKYSIFTTTELSLVEVTNNVSKQPLKKYTTFQEDGRFEFKFVPEGSYILSISSIDYNIKPFKTSIIVSSNDTVTAYLLQGAHRLDELCFKVPHPIRVIVDPEFPTREYSVKRTSSLLQSGPVATVLNNPLYLGGIVVVGALLLLPVLLEKFDPETAKFMKEQKMAAQEKNNKAALEAAAKFQQQTSGAMENIGLEKKVKEGKQSIKNRRR